MGMDGSWAVPVAEAAMTGDEWCTASGGAALLPIDLGFWKRANQPDGD
jgi:hypothetical protein